MSDLTQAQKTNIICFLFHVDVHFETLMCVSVQIAMEVRYLIREQRQWGWGRALSGKGKQRKML